MARPLKKDVNGVNVLGTFGGAAAGAAVDSSAGIRVTGRFGATTDTDYYLVKQRGARTYVVTRDGATRKTGVLVESINNGIDDGQILITASSDGLSPGVGNSVSIAKLTKRIATDFSGNRYKWRLSKYEDSSGDIIVLTAV
jgi:hypothetical protein